MAEPQRVPVDLAALLRDLQPKALKGLVCAPIGYRADRLIELAAGHAPRLGTISHGDLVSALLHAARPDGEEIGRLIEEYREAHVWETRNSLGEKTSTKGSWDVPIRSRGQRSV